MVENQQSIKTVLSFGAKSVEPEILELLLIGRGDAAQKLTHSIENIALHGNNQQILIVGQRGMGKTHMLRILYHRATTFMKERQLQIAYFTEEEYGVVDFFDFLIRVLYAFIRWNKEDQTWLSQKLEELQSTPQTSQPRLLENILKEYIGNRPLLILAENFGDILNSMGKEEQGKLRAWLYDNDRVSIIATSQSLSDDFDREDRPFYGFFTVYYLKNLTLEETVLFLVSLANLEGRKDVKDYILNKGKGRVRAVHQLVKGNHRLLVTFYEFLKSDTLAALSNHFIKTINDLKPYYETYIRYLPAQQQKIVRFIALARKPQLGTDIGRHCFIEQGSLSKQLSELVRKGLLEALPDRQDRRNKLYDINEPLLRISIEIGENREGITALFIDFLALFYDEHELLSKKNRFLHLLNDCKTTQEQQYLRYEIQAIERALALKYNTRDIVAFWKKINDTFESETTQSDLDWVVEWIDKIPSDVYYMGLGDLLVLYRKYEEAISMFEKVSDQFGSYEKTLGLWAMCIARIARDNKDEVGFDLAFNKFKKAESLGEKNELFYWSWGISLFDYASIVQGPEVFNEAVSTFKKAIAIKPSVVDFYLTLAERSLSIGNPSNNPIALNEAVSALQIALSLNPHNEKAVGLLGGLVAFFGHLLENGNDLMSIFTRNFAGMPPTDRIKLWQKFKFINHPEFFQQLFSQFKKDIALEKEGMQSVLIEWVVGILGTKRTSLTSSQLEQLKSLLESMIEEVPVIRILIKYIDTYERGVLQKDGNAIYELPKEQRLFFEQHILHQEQNG